MEDDLKKMIMKEDRIFFKTYNDYLKKKEEELKTKKMEDKLNKWKTTTKKM